MPDKPPVPAHALGEKREKTIQALIESFAADRLSVEEFEARLDRAHRAVDLATLEDLIQDLPAPAAPSPSAKPAPAPARSRAVARADEVRDKQVLVAVMGGVTRQGTWTPARYTFIFAMMGGAEIDLREARLLPGTTEFEIFVMWGGVEILVPPDVIVDCNGIALLGGFEHGPGSTVPPLPDTPIIKISGFALMGAVEISVRQPGETARDAKRRLRDERKRLARPPRDSA
jgi:hypothetical protein